MSYAAILAMAFCELKQYTNLNYAIISWQRFSVDLAELPDKDQTEPERNLKVLENNGISGYKMFTHSFNVKEKTKKNN